MPSSGTSDGWHALGRWHEDTAARPIGKAYRILGGRGRGASRAAARDRLSIPPMRTIVLSVLLAAGLAAPAAAQGRPPVRDTALEAELRRLAARVRGTVGIYVHHLPSGRTAALDADSLFPTASMVKVPILATLAARLEEGRLGWHDSLTYTDSLLYEGEDMLGEYRNGGRITIDRLALLMMTMSDNTASLWLQALVGGGAAVNAWLDANGFAQTRVNSRTPGREANRSQFGWGQTTPREMATLLLRFREGRVASPAASEQLYRVLTRQYWNGEGLSQLPPWVQAATKNGAVDRSRSEVMLVNAPSGDYVYCVITKAQEDTSWTASNEGFVLLREVAALLWRTFEPAHPWRPSPGAERYRP